jgi:hypothetical protein
MEDSKRYGDQGQKPACASDETTVPMHNMQPAVSKRVGSIGAPKDGSQKESRSFRLISCSILKKQRTVIWLVYWQVKVRLASNGNKASAATSCRISLADSAGFFWLSLARSCVMSVKFFQRDLGSTVSFVCRSLCLLDLPSLRPYALRRSRHP